MLNHSLLACSYDVSINSMVTPMTNMCHFTPSLKTRFQNLQMNILNHLELCVIVCSVYVSTEYTNSLKCKMHSEIRCHIRSSEKMLWHRVCLLQLVFKSSLNLLFTYTLWHHYQTGTFRPIRPYNTFQMFRCPDNINFSEIYFLQHLLES